MQWFWCTAFCAPDSTWLTSQRTCAAEVSAFWRLLLGRSSAAVDAVDAVDVAYVNGLHSNSDGLQPTRRL